MSEPDFVRLIEYCLKIAKKALSRYTTFDPFAAMLIKGGEVRALILPASNEAPSLQTLLKEYKTLMRTTAAKGEATAIALCFDGRLSLDGLLISQVDEIRLRLEHSEDDAIDVVIPYRKGFWGNQYETMTAVRRKRVFFSDTGPG